MRFRLEITTVATELPWRCVLTPGRGVAYDLLNRVAPQLGCELHERGMRPFGMVPFGHGAPLFPTARRRRGKYVTGGPGYVEFGSPVAAVVEAWATALRGQNLVDWGGVAFRVVRFDAIDPPNYSSGRATIRTETPVVLKTGIDERGGRTPWVLPTEPEFPSCLLHNLRHKAETLDLSPEIDLDAITWTGPKRTFAVGHGAKPGAAVEVRLTGEPETLQAIWSWGLGESNTAGFGWIGAGC